MKKYNEEEVINLADKMREEAEGVGLSDALVKIVIWSYRQGIGVEEPQ